MARLEWDSLSNKWWLLVDHDSGKIRHWVKYRPYDRGKGWQIVYSDPTKNHGLLQSEFTEEQLRRKLEMEYLLTREE